MKGNRGLSKRLSHIQMGFNLQRAEKQNSKERTEMVEEKSCYHLGLVYREFGSAATVGTMISETLGRKQKRKDAGGASEALR